MTPEIQGLIDMSHGYGWPKFYKIIKTWTNWYWILANDPYYNLASDMCGQNYNLDAHSLKGKIKSLSIIGS